ncbi:MAG TPA: sugar phosphate isomerase/epimerase [Cyclobacteriaceae bacterium]|nr:sugar phosphate isomerase/epimerase [Cyclobacteriaceae bacterium]
MKNEPGTKEFSRRRFIGVSALAVAGLVSGPSFGAPAIVKNLGKPNSKIAGVQIGVITYSFRSMPTDAESVLKYCLESGVSAIELMGGTAEEFAGAPQMQKFSRKPESPEEKEEMRRIRDSFAKETADWRAKTSMDKFKQLRKTYADAGVSIYAWKPSALGMNNSDAEIDYALRVAKALHASHVTLELPKDPTHSLRLGKHAARHKVRVGYHGHLQQTYTAWDEALRQSRYNALNLDLGHYVAAGLDPFPLLRDKHKDIVSMHLKDRRSKENGQTNMPWGQGDTPIAKVLQLMRDEKYKFPGTIELEYKIPENSDAVQEVGKCLEFCRKALEG